MKIETLTQWQRACTLDRAGLAVFKGEMTENEYRVLVGIYALSGDAISIDAASSKYLSVFLNSKGKRLYTDPNGNCPTVENILDTLKKGGWIDYCYGDGRMHIYPRYYSCGGCPTAENIGWR